MRNKSGRGHIMQVGTCEQWVCMLLIILCMQCSLASWLEDIKEQLTASLTVFHRVVTLHRHEQRNQVRHRYGAVDSSVYKKQKHTVKTRLNEVSFLKTEWHQNWTRIQHINLQISVCFIWSVCFSFANSCSQTWTCCEETSVMWTVLS